MFFFTKIFKALQKVSRCRDNLDKCRSLEVIKITRVINNHQLIVSHRDDAINLEEIPIYYLRHANRCDE